MADTEGFEPSIELLTLYSLSRGAPSATRPRILGYYELAGSADEFNTKDALPAHLSTHPHQYYFQTHQCDSKAIHHCARRDRHAQKDKHFSARRGQGFSPKIHVRCTRHINEFRAQQYHQNYDRF